MLRRPGADVDDSVHRIDSVKCIWLCCYLDFNRTTGTTCSQCYEDQNVSFFPTGLFLLARPVHRSNEFVQLWRVNVEKKIKSRRNSELFCNCFRLIAFANKYAKAETVQAVAASLILQ